MELFWAFLWFVMGLFTASAVHAYTRYDSTDWRYPASFHGSFWLWPLAWIVYGPSVFRLIRARFRLIRARFRRV